MKDAIIRHALSEGSISRVRKGEGDYLGIGHLEVSQRWVRCDKRIETIEQLYSIAQEQVSGGDLLTIKKSFTTNADKKNHRFLLVLQQWHGNLTPDELVYLETMLRWASDNVMGAAYEDFVRKLLPFWGITEFEIECFLASPRREIKEDDFT